MTQNSLYNDRLIMNNFQPDVKAFYFREWDNFKMDAFHTHDRVEIMYVISGSCIINVKDFQVKFKKSDFILIDADVPHQLLVDKNNPCRMLNIEFAFKERQNILPSVMDLVSNVKEIASMLTMKCNYFILKDNEEVYHTLKNLIMELSLENDKNEFSIQLFLMEVLLKIAKMIHMNYGNSATNIHIKKTVDFISMNYDRDISVKELSEHINVNEDYLHRIFKQHMGYTIIEFLTSMRMEKAKMLLKNT